MVDTLFIVPFMQLLYEWLLEGVSVFLWEIARAGLLAGYVIGRVSAWLVDQGFGSTVLLLTEQGRPIFLLMVVIAVIVLGVTYVLVAWVRVHVVDWRAALGWLLFGLLFYSIAPGLYVEGEHFRRELAESFYEILLTQADLDSVRADLGGVSSRSSASLGTVADQFGDAYVDGLDVAMAYVLADGRDVLESPDSLPVAYRAVYGDPSSGASRFLVMTPEERHASIVLVTRGIGRLLLVWLIIIFGLFEQLIYLLLGVAAGLLFVQMAVALPFALFVRTEVMARALVDLWLELFIKTVAIALCQAFAVSLVLLGAELGNPVLTIGTSMIGWGLMAIFLVAAIRAVWDALNRMFAALSSLTGNRITPPGQAAAAATGAAMGVATAGLGLAAGAGLAAASGALALGAGASHAGALGAALGKNRAVYSAAAMGSRMLPESSPHQAFAEQVFEGALYRRMMGPIGAVALGAQSRGAVRSLPGRGSGGPPKLSINTRELADAIGQAIDRAPKGGYPSFLQASAQVAQTLGHPVSADKTPFGNTTVTVGAIVTSLHQAGVSGRTATQAIKQAAESGALSESLEQELQQAGQRSGVRNLPEQVRRAGQTIARRTENP